MSELEDKLNAILSNPDAMSQVMGLARSLSGSGAFDTSAGGEEPVQHTQHTQTSGNDRAVCGNMGVNIGDLFSQIDPKMIERLLPLLGEFGRGDNDERVQLLYALRPFLKPERRDKVERAVKAAKLIHIGKKFLSSMGEPYV